jgi:hypothetical protein
MNLLSLIRPWTEPFPIKISRNKTGPSKKLSLLIPFHTRCIVSQMSAGEEKMKRNMYSYGVLDYWVAKGI